MAANENTDEGLISVASGDEVVADAANEDGFVRLARYGDWAHPAGRQRFDRQAGDKIASTFKSALSRFKRALFGSPLVPIYMGHPDDVRFAANGHDDNQRYAEIEDIESREDGLYIKPAWSEAGQALLASRGKLYFSPRWGMRPVTEGGREYVRPFKLLSVGLTEKPNIPGSAANANPEPDNTMLKKLLILLGFTGEQAEAAANSADGAPSAEEVAAKLNDLTTAANENASSKQEAATQKARADRVESDNKKLNDDLAAANATVKAERTKRAELIVG
ncbi:MAG: phage protease, partial [Verrucomicrobiota bacterium]